MVDSESPHFPSLVDMTLCPFQSAFDNSSPIGENPSCLQTTAASCASHPWSQIVPHLLLEQISTLPSCSFVPLTSQTPFSTQGSG